jgi:hypothetical protein
MRNIDRLDDGRKRPAIFKFGPDLCVVRFADKIVLFGADQIVFEMGHTVYDIAS